MIIKLNDTIKTVIGADAVDNNELLTIRIALLNLFHYHRCPSPKDEFTLHNVVQEIAKESVSEIDTEKFGPKKTEFIRKVVKENHGQASAQGTQSLYLSFFRVQIMMAVGLTENDV